MRQRGGHDDTDSNQKKDSAPEWIFSFIQAGFWMSFCISVSFAAAYLQALGYSNSQPGIILALGNLMGIAVATSLFSWIDSSEKIAAKLLIPWLLLLQAVSVTVLLSVPTRSTAVSAGFAAYIGFCTSVNSINLKLYADADQAGQSINYSFTRGIGSVAYVFISVLLGYLSEVFSYRIIPVLGLILCAVQYLAFRMFAPYVSKGNKAEPFGEHNSSLPAFL